VFTKSFGPGLIFWYDLRNEKETRFGTWNVRLLYRAGSLTAAARELARYTLDLVVVQEAGGSKGAR
jgi:hypothetical protein